MSTIKTQNLIDNVIEYFDGKDGAREKALKVAREISKGATVIIRKVHNRGDLDLAALFSELKVLEKKYKDLKTGLKAYPELYHSTMLENYIQELAEAIIMLELIKNDFKTTKLPDPNKLGLPYTTYFLGLGDVIGELRRCTVDALRKKELSEANKYLDAMEQLYEIIINLNYPDKVLPLRRKQDIARSLIEKTRSELVFAVSGDSVVENINDLKRDLNSYYKKIVRKN